MSYLHFHKNAKIIDEMNKELAESEQQLEEVTNKPIPAMRTLKPSESSADVSR